MLFRLRTSPVARRIAGALFTLFGVSVAVFLMLRAIPGDQITAAYGVEAAALSEDQREALRSYYGLDQPLFLQYFTWLGAIFTGNLGYSMRSHQSVLDMTALSFPVTLELAVLSVLFALLIGIPVGMLSASRPNALRDWFGQGVGLAGLGIPSFLLATFLLGIAAQSWGFNPNGLGYARPWEDLWLNLQQMLLPSLVLGFAIAAPIMRTTRTAVLEVRSLDFVRTAKAKGVPASRLRWRHVLRNALVPVVTMTGMQFGFLLGGAVIVEQIFSLPGLGRQVLLAMNQQEYSVVQSTVLIIALLFVIVNLLTDLLYRKIDPRVRAE
ncbi:MAG TPA: ABC transporter permease [Candidatus Agrococcus pullicola]|uniref:ABC transporter permease n=1 Tax=Candidatus Agrococcus pullicola TaxID=2838429 RepID=A0A9D1YTH8_9MICO|nr:ABC transporter permease [Candidatus Agrococcus pullicola]